MEITVGKGRSFECVLRLKRPDGTVYVPEQNDIVRFGVKLSTRDTDYRILKEWTAADVSGGGVLLQISAKETEAMPVGDHYLWDVSIQRGEECYHVGQKTPYPFHVTQTVTRAEVADG